MGQKRNESNIDILSEPNISMEESQHRILVDLCQGYIRRLTELEDSLAYYLERNTVLQAIEVHDPTKPLSPYLTAWKEHLGI